MWEAVGQLTQIVYVEGTHADVFKELYTKYPTFYKSGIRDRVNDPIYPEAIKIRKKRVYRET
ncbi:hypothetical protein DCM90_02005 [Levilactobacillus bambusae]|uniref:Uncharacterized protein n=1 Tax=Levilactobacillus bambusae TaxID=2024736 RepID=A0A2V1N1P0_9LACO|nr:hypothetical protein DCM90_02005 [Levilactobacillus bambusae]